MASIGLNGRINMMATGQLKSGGDKFIHMAAEQLGMEDYIEKALTWGSDHPFFATLLVMSAGFSIIPLVSFLTFVLVCLVFGFVVLLVIEGTIITFAGLIFLLVLGGCLTIALSTTVFLSVSYKTLTALLGLIGRSQPRLLGFTMRPRQPDNSTSNHTLSKEKIEADYIKEE